MRYLPPVSIVLSLLICFPAHATSIRLDPALYINSIAFLNSGTPDVEIVPLEFANLSVANAGSSASSTGSGIAIASVGGGGPSNGVDISTRLLSGPGSARATAFSSSTFDLLFPRAGFYSVQTILEINGEIDIDPGDSGFAFWEIFFEFPSDDRIGFGGIFGDFLGSRNNPFECIGRGCFIPFDFNDVDLFFRVGKVRRFPVTANIFFDVGVSRTTAVPEPNVIFLIIFGLMILACTKGKMNPTSARIPSTRKAHSSAAFHVQAGAPRP